MKLDKAYEAPVFRHWIIGSVRENRNTEGDFHLHPRSPARDNFLTTAQGNGGSGSVIIDQSLGLLKLVEFAGPHSTEDEAIVQF